MVTNVINEHARVHTPYAICNMHYWLCGWTPLMRLIPTPYSCNFHYKVTTPVIELLFIKAVIEMYPGDRTSFQLNFHP